ELRPMHALPCRHGEGGWLATKAQMGCGALGRTHAGNDRFIDLRPRPGGDEPGEAGAETFREGCVMSDGSGVLPPGVKFFLDGVEVEAMPGETIWSVAQRYSTEIPHLCFSTAPGYRPDGNCRACMIEIEGERALAASCIRKPTAGMKVHAKSERAAS